MSDLDRLYDDTLAYIWREVMYLSRPEVLELLGIIRMFEDVNQREYWVKAFADDIIRLG